MSQPTLQPNPNTIVSSTTSIPQSNPSIIYLPTSTAPPGDLLTFLVVVALTMLAKVLTDSSTTTK